MGSSQFFNSYLLVMALLATLHNHTTAQENDSTFPTGFNAAERDALLALKYEFNNSFLNHNWTSIMCYMNNPPRWHGIQCVNGRVTGIVLENMGLIGKIKEDALFNLTQLTVLSFKNNSLSGNMMDFSQTLKLKSIDLSGNEFDGPIPDSLRGLNFLETLQLQENNLSGSIPAYEQPSLRFFNASNNRLSVTNTTKDEKPKKHHSTLSPYVVILLVVDVLGIVFIVSLFVVYNRKSKKMKEEIEGRDIADEEKVESLEIIREESEDERGGERSKLMFMDSEVGFGLRDLMRASAVGLGKGSFGTCYKAQLENGVAVAVKRLRDLRSTLTQEEFGRQSQVMASQKHPNLLPLLACFNSVEEKLLLYKFASNGNVYNRIHGGRGTKDRIPFRWSARLSVARGVARALEHLHTNPTNSQPPFLPPPHGNLKSSNVLLDENDVVLVSDYGLSSFFTLPVAAQRLVSYKSPEYQTHKRASKKSDVWSYGIFLLELLTGRVSAHSAPPGVSGVDLGSWVHRAVREEWTAEIFDVEIAAQRSAAYPMLRLLEIAIRCSDKSPGKWPEMSEVVREVENIKVVVDSEDEDGDGDGDEDEFSYDQSLTDDSMSGASSIVLSGGDER